MAYEQELDFAIRLAKESGEVYREKFSLEMQTDWKHDNTPVTEADTAINQLIIQRVKESFPEHGVLGEEDSYEVGRNSMWVVDPIDGTIAFSLGLPLSTISIAYAVQGVPQVGVVYEPVLDRLFSAARGGGAFMNGEQLQVSPSESIAHNFMCLSSTMASEHVTSGAFFDEIERSGGKALNFRSFAYGAALVGAGKFIGAHLGMRSKTWDIAAATVIVEEAGGKVTDLAGNDLRCDQPFKGALASNGTMHGALLKMINA